MLRVNQSPPLRSEAFLDLSRFGEQRYLRASPIVLDSSKLVSPTFASNSSIKHSYWAAQAPSSSELASDIFLVRAIETNQGLFQFVSDHTYKNLIRANQPPCSEGDRGTCDDVSIVQYIAERYARLGRFCIGHQYEVVSPPILQTSNTYGASYLLTVQNLRSDKFWTVPITQAGLALNDGVLMAKDIAIAADLLDMHVSHVGAQYADVGTQAMILSTAGSAQNASLIVYKYLCSLIQRGQVIEDNLDLTLDRAIHHVQAVCSSMFISHERQFEELRAALLHYIEHNQINIVRQEHISSLGLRGHPFNALVDSRKLTAQYTPGSNIRFSCGGGCIGYNTLNRAVELIASKMVSMSRLLGHGARVAVSSIGSGDLYPDAVLLMEMLKHNVASDIDYYLVDLKYDESNHSPVIQQFKTLFADLVTECFPHINLTINALNRLSHRQDDTQVNHRYDYVFSWASDVDNPGTGLQDFSSSGATTLNHYSDLVDSFFAFERFIDSSNQGAFSNPTFAAILEKRLPGQEQDPRTSEPENLGSVFLLPNDFNQWREVCLKRVKSNPHSYADVSTLEHKLAVAFDKWLVSTPARISALPHQRQHDDQAPSSLQLRSPAA